MAPRIIILNDRARARGGATGLAVLAARLLHERGREVMFVSGDAGESAALIDAGVARIALGQEGLSVAQGRLAQIGRGIWNRKAAAFLSDWIAREGRPDDIWHLHNWAQIWSPSVFSALEPVKSRLIVHAHDYFNACPNGAFWNFPEARQCSLVPMSSACLRSNCDKRSYPQKLWRVARQVRLGDRFRRPDAPQLLLIHPGMRERFLRSGFQSERIGVLRNPVQPFLPTPIDASRNRGLLFVGRLEQEKGALLLAHAAARADLPVTFVGEGAEAAAIRAACPHAVLTGWQDPAGIARHAAGARALVMPSVVGEPYGLVAVEALGSGLPVVISQTALLAPEIVGAGAGWAVDVTDGAEFARILAEVCDGSADIATMSLSAARVAPQLGLTPQAWCDGLEAAYQGLIAGASTRMPAARSIR